MAPKRSGPRGRDEVPSVLAAALAPHVDQLAAAAAEREAELVAEQRVRAERAKVSRLDEAELMQLIFTHLDDDNPRVCVGIEFDRLVVLREPAQVEPVAAEPVGVELAKPEPATGIEPSGVEPTPRLAGHVWSGHGWSDEVIAIDPAALDRPGLDAKQRALLRRASGRSLPTLNLRRLEREPAIAHLEIFVHACRQQRLRCVRVITGKGIESKAEPVLKRAVLHWCRREGLASAPELDVHGEFGALVIELVR